MQPQYFKPDNRSGGARRGSGHDSGQQRLIVDSDLALPSNLPVRSSHGNHGNHGTSSSNMTEPHFESAPYSAPAWMSSAFGSIATTFPSHGPHLTTSAAADDFIVVNTPIYQHQRPDLSSWASGVPFTTAAPFPSAPTYTTSSYTFPPYSGSPVHQMSLSPSPIPAPLYQLSTSYENPAFHMAHSRAINFEPVMPTDTDAVSSGSSCSDRAQKKQRSQSLPASGRRPSKPRISRTPKNPTGKSRKRFESPDKHKTEFVRDMGACWRCRRYKKSCDGPGTCKNCSHGRFRVWPDSLGCRRGCLEDLVTPVLPPHAADVLGPAAQIAFKSPNWRYGMVDVEQRRVIEERLPMCNRWERLDWKVQSTGMYGEEFSSLLHILINYQESQTRPSPLLENSILLLDSACDIYHNFVESAWPREAADIATAIANAQRANASVCKMFLTSALSGKGRDWLPSFLSMCMAFVAVMIIMDAAVAVPHREREQVWGDLHNVSRGLRTGLYPVTIDLLRASSNGSKPFAMGCWSVTRTAGAAEGNVPLGLQGELIRNEAGLDILGGDKAAFDGMHALQQWIRSHISLLDLGSRVITSDPFTTPEVPCIAPVLKLFDI